MTILAAANLLSEGSGVPTDQRSWIIYGAAIAGAIYLFLRPMLRRRKARGALAEDGGRPFGGKSPGSLSRERAVEREMSHLLVQLSTMARQITAQLDTRSAKLELLIQEADRAIGRLEVLRRRGDAAAGEGQPPLKPERPAEAPREEAEPASLADDADDAGEPRAARSAEAARHADIYGLADEGRSPQEIAHALARPRGEVELILALRR